MSDKKKNILIAVVFLAFGIFLYWQSMGIRHMMKNDVGSAFFPKVVAVAIIVVAIFRLVMALREKESEVKASNNDLRGGLETILLIIVYVFAFNPVGFLISTAVYLFLQMLVLAPAEKRNLPLFAGLSVAVPIFVYIMFVYVIKTVLPRGLFGF